MEYIILAAAFLTGFVVAWLIQLSLRRKMLSGIEQRDRELTVAKNEIEKQCSVLEETLRIRTEEITGLQQSLAVQVETSGRHAGEIARLNAVNESYLEKLETRKKETEELQKRLTTEFENIANKILRERADDLAHTHHRKIGEILDPLREKIQLFEKKVDETYDKELRDKISLREEVRKLTELNTRISEEAHNLTRALKGDIKKQGNWGEVILERVLERSGLIKGQEYEREEVISGTDNCVQRPDVIIHLPDSKHIIIDSKVSLVAYERFASAETEEEKALHLKDHILSLRSHVRILCEKNYQNARNINSPDFVLLFVPIEASFSAAVQDDNELFSYAWERKIVIVSPTTLLATLRTVSSIWKQENQTRNAREIARLSGALYDKFVGFTEDMLKIKNNIDRASSAYEDAVNKMRYGKGNIIRTAERIRELGAKTGNKEIPAEIIGHTDITGDTE